MYKSGNKRIEACSVPFCASVFLAVVLNLLLWSPHMIQTGSQLEEFGWHSWGTCLMPRVQKSLLQCILHCKKKKKRIHNSSKMGVFSKKINPPHYIWSHLGPQVPHGVHQSSYFNNLKSLFCFLLFFMSVNWNKVSSVVFFTDLVDQTFFLITHISNYAGCSRHQSPQ